MPSTRSRVLTALVVGGMLAAGAGLAQADVVKNAVAPNGIGVGGRLVVAYPATSAVVPYSIQATGQGCDAADG